MKKKRHILITILVLFLGVQIGAVEFEVLLDMALKTSPNLKIQKIELENLKLENEKKEVKKLPSVLLSTGATGVTYTFSPTASDIKTTPSLQLKLGGDINTQLDLNVTLSNSFSNPGNISIGPSLKLTQPLNPLFGWEPTKLYDEIKDSYDLNKQKLEHAKTVIAVKKTLLNALKDINNNNKALDEADNELKEARDELTKAKTLNEYNENSAPFKTLLFKIQILNRKIELLKKQKIQVWKILSDLCGKKMETIPGKLPEMPLVVPGSDSIEKNSDVYFSRLDQKLAQLEWEEKKKGYIPEFEFTGSYTDTVTEVKGLDDPLKTKNVTLGLKSGFNNIEFGMSFTYDFNYHSLATSIDFNWLIASNREDNIEKNIVQNDLKIQNIKTHYSEIDHENALLNYEILVYELYSRETSLDEEAITTNLNWVKTKQRHAEGVIGADEYKKAQWNLKLLDYERYDCNIDKCLLALSLEEFSLMPWDSKTNYRE